MRTFVSGAISAVLVDPVSSSLTSSWAPSTSTSNKGIEWSPFGADTPPPEIECELVTLDGSSLSGSTAVNPHISSSSLASSAAILRDEFKSKYFNKRPVVFKRGFSPEVILSRQVLLAFASNFTAAAAAGETRSVTSTDTIHDRSSLKVQVGTSGEIINADGQGATVMDLASFLNSMGSAPTAAANNSNRVNDQMKGKSLPDKYLFDRGHLFLNAPEKMQRALLSGLPALMPPLTTAKVEGGFIMDTKPTVADGLDLGVVSAYGTSWLKDLEVGPAAGQDAYLLIGGNGTGVSWHAHASSLVGLHAGVKRWLLAPPDTYPIPRHHHPRGLASGDEVTGRGENNASAKQDETNNVESEADPLRAVTLQLQCLQQPGDLIYVPEGWHHATINYGETVAVALQARIATEPLRQTQHIAQQLRKMGRLHESLEVHTVGLQRWPSDTTLLRSLAALELKMAARKQEEAETTADQTQLHTAGQGFQRAVKLLQQAIEKDPTDNEGALLLCEAATYGQQAEMAAAGCELAVRLNPWSANAAFRRGVYLAGSAQHTDAIADLERAVKLDPKLHSAWYHLANNYMVVATSISGKHGQDASAEASNVQSTRQIKQAARAYRRVIRLQPDNAQAYFEYGMALMRTPNSHLEEVRAVIGKAVVLEPKYQEHVSALFKQHSGGKHAAEL